MEIVIIGDPERKEMDKPLITKSKKIFSKSTYVPVTDVKIEAGKKGRIISLEDSFMRLFNPRLWERVCTLVAFSAELRTVSLSDSLWQ